MPGPASPADRDGRDGRAVRPRLSGVGLDAAFAKIDRDLHVPEDSDNQVAAAANAKYYSEFKAAVNTVLHHTFFETVPTEQPVGIFSAGDMKGHKHAFKQEDFDEAMQNTGQYEASCNFWWQSFKPAQPGIPINQRAVANLTEHWFATAPPKFPAVVTIAAHRDMIVDRHKGDLLRASAQEIVHAFIFGCRDAIVRGMSDEELHIWKRAMLTVTFDFELILTQEELYWRAANLREKVVSEFRAVALTPVQRVCQILEFKNSREKTHGRMSAKVGCQRNFR